MHWESPDITLYVANQVAEMVSLLPVADTEITAGETMRCEATLRGIAQSQGLKLEFWAKTSTGAFEELAIAETKALDADEQARYIAEVEARRAGRYTTYAYLYDGTQRIGRRVETILVEDA